jgi:aryl-alcohol dehydrogenase-like predicted oxidoreductase
MKYGLLGRTDLNVSKIGLGATGIGGHNLFVYVDEAESIGTVFRALELGVNFIDTADYYGCGRSETLIGKALRASGKPAILATKGGLRWDDRGRFVRRDNSPAYLRQAVEASLKRLQREVIDLYYIHAPDGRTPPADSFGELQRLRDEGKIRWAGLSNCTLEQAREAAAAGPLAAVQNQYSIFDRRPAGDGLLEFCAKRGIAFVPYGALCFGILSGKYRRDFRLEEQDWRNALPYFHPRAYPTVVITAQRLADWAKRRGMQMPHVAIGWTLRHPAIATCLVGAKRPDQIAENIVPDGFELTPHDLAAIDQHCTAARLPELLSRVHHNR